MSDLKDHFLQEIENVKKTIAFNFDAVPNEIDAKWTYAADSTTSDYISEGFDTYEMAAKLVTEQPQLIENNEGYFNKFEVRKTNEPVDPASDYFVLDCRDDPHAIAALHAYADSVKNENPELASQIIGKVGGGQRTAYKMWSMESWVERTGMPLSRSRMKNILHHLKWEVQRGAARQRTFEKLLVRSFKKNEELSNKIKEMKMTMTVLKAVMEKVRLYIEWAQQDEDSVWLRTAVELLGKPEDDFTSSQVMEYAERATKADRKKREALWWGEMLYQGVEKFLDGKNDEDKLREAFGEYKESRRYLVSGLTNALSKPEDTTQVITREELEGRIAQAGIDGRQQAIMEMQCEAEELRERILLELEDELMDICSKGKSPEYRRHRMKELINEVKKNETK